MASVAAAVFVSVLAVGGCRSDGSGYRFNATYDRGVTSVAVPVASNRTMVTGLETDVTEAVAKEIQRATPWRVTGGAQADTELTIEIVDARLSTVSTNRRSGLPDEQTYEITVNFAWRDNRTGRDVQRRERFTAVGVFSPMRQVGERIEVGQRQAVQDLARDLVAELRTAW
jgi:ABC-type amino acid transport substrate-binding protein